MTSRKIPTTYLLKNSYARSEQASINLEFMRTYYFENCTPEEQDHLDSLVLAMVDNVHKRSTAPFSPANALEILGALVMHFERAHKLGWQPAIRSEDIIDKGGQACTH